MLPANSQWIESCKLTMFAQNSMFPRTLLLSVAALLVQAHSAEDRPRFDEIANAGQYFHYSRKVTWNEGSNYCASQGAQMVTIDSDDESEGLKMLLPSYNVKSVHIGFHDQFVESQYTTIDGVAIASNSPYWATGFPTNTNTTNCGGFTADGMRDISCNTKQGTICELRNVAGYVPIQPYGLYNYHNETRSWADAWEVCRAEGGHLWVIDSALEASAVMVNYRQITDVWVGVHRLSGDDAFMTVLGKPLGATGFLRWSSGNPFGTSASRPFVAASAERLSSPNQASFWTNTDTGVLPFMCEHAPL